MNRIFHRSGLLLSALSVLVLLAACSSSAGTPSTEALTTAPAAPTAAAAPSLPTSAPGATTAPVTLPSVGPAGGGTPVYLDDRSTPEGVIQSFYNAINRREYARAYSYWEPEAAAQSLPPFAEWQEGYTGTGTVELTLGTEQTGVGAGQIYASVPVTVRAQQADGSSQIFVGCYQLHLANPGIQSEPPFRPLGIRSADVRPVAALADTAALMRSVCQ